MPKGTEVNEFDGDYSVDDSAPVENHIESFDDFGYGGEESSKMESFDDDEDEGQAPEKETVQAKENEEVDSGSQVNMLKDQEEKGTEEKEEKSDKSDEESKDADEKSDDPDASKDDDGEDDGDSEEEVRTLKAFRGGKAYEVPEDATVPVKINGKTEKVGLKDLRDSYSGKVRYDEKFNDLEHKVKEFETEREGHMTQINEIAGTMKEVRELFSAAKEGEAHPFDGVNKILDSMGINSVEYNKLAMERMAEELGIFNEMSDSEREAYWLNKENKYLVDRQESERSKSAEVEAQRERQAAIKETREAHGVSEDDFNSAYEELLNDGEENITVEQVVQVAKLNPLLDTADDIMSKYADQLSTDEMNEMVQTIAVTMYKHPDYSIEDIKNDIAEELEVETIVSEITDTSRSPKKIKGSAKKVETIHGYESFDDF